jgi:glucosyl-3-phosphoglycerate synthase
VDPRAADWFRRRTSTSDDWPLARVAAAKAATGARISVVIPARNEEATIASVVGRIGHDLGGIVDELVVMDSLSGDRTAERATAAGATVHSVADVRADLGVQAGKGEALWKSQFVTSGDILVFVDADLTEWGPHFVLGLLGPLLAEPGVALVKGFYDRVDQTSDRPSTEGGRVTELVARPLLALHWPELGAVVQPLAGEWAIRRDLFAGLFVPVGYGVELATLLDTLAARGPDAIAQVDLGRRAHRHQSVHDLGVMAAEILRVADRRLPGRPTGVGDSVVLSQYDRGTARWQERPVPVGERPPAAATDLPEVS